MQTVVGIFTSQAAAECAAERLGSVGIAREQINFLIPGASQAQLEQVSTTETEQPGMGAALGGVVGGAIGASGLMNTAVITTLVPGVGPIAVIGFVSLALVGLLGGALVGATVGGALESVLSDGLPKDELLVYEDALRQGWTVLIVATEDATQAEAGRVELAQAGAESLDAARDTWWVGLRDAEAETYTAQGWDFTKDEPCIDAALKRRGAPTWLASPIQTWWDICRPIIPTCIGAKRSRAAMPAGRPITRSGWHNARPEHCRPLHGGVEPLTILTAPGRAAKAERSTDDQRGSHFPHW